MGYDIIITKDDTRYQTSKLGGFYRFLREGEVVRCGYSGDPEADHLFEMRDEGKSDVVALGVIKGGVLVEVLRSPDIPSAYGYEGEALEWMEREVMRLYEKHDLKPWQVHVNLS